MNVKFNHETGDEYVIMFWLLLYCTCLKIEWYFYLCVDIILFMRKGVSNELNNQYLQHPNSMFEYACPMSLVFSFSGANNK